jgi:hypothetical protein
MTSTDTTDETVAGAAGPSAAGTIAALLRRSNALGADPRNTNYAGGNTSAKGTDVDPVTGQDVELLWVKGSGGDLGTLEEKGLAVLRLDRVRALREVYPGLAAGAAPPRRSTPRCTPWSTPRTWTICIPMRGSRSRPRPTGSA